MIEPTGAELAARLRALLPIGKQASYDEMLDVYSYEVDGDPNTSTSSACGALMALTGPFRDCLADREFAAAGSILDEMERLLNEHPQGQGLDGSVWNSVLTCFLESVLPVDATSFGAIRPGLGPIIVAHAKQYDPWWLEPEPYGGRVTSRDAD